MRIGLHAYTTDPLLPQRDGVNFAHENFTRLLSEADDPELEVVFHDFNSLMGDLEAAREVLTGLDCVFSNVGPHAQYYFWLREKLGLDFRIVRDVRTAIWSSYLVQEHLIAPLLRADDTLMVASNYVWAVYLRMFPGLADHPAAVCYPLSICFPPERPARRAALPRGSGTINLGYLGRLSEDKNFPDIVDLVIRLNRDAPADLRYRLIACGEVHSDSCAPEHVREQIAARLGEGDWYEYLPARRHTEIWELFDRFDLMIFPSTSNLETFGRVLIEASYAHVPIVAGRHAATPELVDHAGLCRVDYRTGQPFVSHFDHCLGRVDVSEMARAIATGELRPSESYASYAEHPAQFLAMLRETPALAAPELHRSQQAFLDSLDIVLPAPLDRAEAIDRLDELAAWFVALQDKSAPAYAERIAHLREISPYPDRTERFVAKSERTSGDFTNVGGIDIELCHLLQFYPQFTIRAE